MKFNIRFNLRKSDSNKPEKIYMICRWNGNKFVYLSAYSIKPKYWNLKAGEVKNVIAEPNKEEINSHLIDLKKQAFSLYHSALENHIILSKEYLKKGL